VQRNFIRKNLIDLYLPLISTLNSVVYTLLLLFFTLLILCQLFLQLFRHYWFDRYNSFKKIRNILIDITIPLLLLAISSVILPFFFLHKNVDDHAYIGNAVALINGEFKDDPYFFFTPTMRPLFVLFCIPYVLINNIQYVETSPGSCGDWIYHGSSRFFAPIDQNGLGVFPDLSLTLFLMQWFGTILLYHSIKKIMGRKTSEFFILALSILHIKMVFYDNPLISSFEWFIICVLISSYISFISKPDKKHLLFFIVMGVLSCLTRETLIIFIIPLAIHYIFIYTDKQSIRSRKSYFYIKDLKYIEKSNQNLSSYKNDEQNTENKEKFRHRIYRGIILCFLVGIVPIIYFQFFTKDGILIFIWFSEYNRNLIYQLDNPSYLPPTLDNAWNIVNDFLYLILPIMIIGFLFIFIIIVQMIRKKVDILHFEIIFFLIFLSSFFLLFNQLYMVRLFGVAVFGWASLYFMGVLAFEGIFLKIIEKSGFEPSYK